MHVGTYEGHPISSQNCKTCEIQILFLLVKCSHVHCLSTCNTNVVLVAFNVFLWKDVLEFGKI